MKEQKTLYLNVTQQAFDVMVTGEKKFEFRRPSPWITSRIFNKKGEHKLYDVVKVVAGYGNHRPYFIANFKGCFEYLSETMNVGYSNGLTWKMRTGDIIIMLGEMLEVGNVDELDDVVNCLLLSKEVEND